tara:strand:+ start:15440 stop:17062 length:1623 start_codon:yes stop_codon:yes gene_type:complete
MTTIDTINKESKFVKHLPCEKCGSRDNKALYVHNNGKYHSYCFGCNDFQNDTDNEEQVKPIVKQVNKEFLSGEYDNLMKRRINEETCKFFNYQVGKENGKAVHIANYYNSEHKIVAQHLRYPNKAFKWIGDFQNVTLFGQQNWRDGGKKLIITEGELDAMSISQIQKHRYPVVSIPSGVGSAKKFILKELQWIAKFDEIILCFDNDEVGIATSRDCASVLPVRKGKIATLQGKDANELLVKGKENKIIDGIFEAKTFTPQGIILGADTKNILLQDDLVDAIPYGWNGLNNKLKGIRKSELNLICAGTGTGKSQVCRELAYYLIKKNKKVGYIALEESVQRSIRGLVAIEMEKPIHLPEVRKICTKKEMIEAWEKVSNNVCFYDHWGSTDSDDLMNRIRYMVQGLGCEYIFLDHISIVISGLSEGDERRLIDNTMTSLRKLVEELKICLFLVSHLKRLDGNKGHESGEVQVSLSHLRGSQSLAQLSDGIISLSRRQESDDVSTDMTVRVLKNRFCGTIGYATTLVWNESTNRLTEKWTKEN